MPNRIVAFDAIDRVPAPADSGAATDRDRSQTPETSGRISPTVSPKEWKSGRTLKTLSVRPKSIRAAPWAALVEDVAVGENDALRRAFRSGGEDDHRRIVRRPLGEWSLRQEEARDPVEQPDLQTHVLEIDERDAIAEIGDEAIELGLLDESAGGDDRLHLCGAASGRDVRAAGGEVDHRRARGRPR